MGLGTTPPQQNFRLVRKLCTCQLYTGGTQAPFNTSANIQMIKSSQHLVENNKSPFVSIRKQLIVPRIRVKHLVENNTPCVGGFRE